MNAEHIQKILGFFLPDARIGEVIPFGSGHINRTYRVPASLDRDQRAFILQRINETVFPNPPALMHNLRKINAHLRKKNYPLELLEAIASPSGADLYRDEAGGYWRLFPFIENTISFDTLDAPGLAEAGAHAFGLFITELADLPASELQETIPHFHDAAFRRTQYLEALREDVTSRRKEATPEIEAVQVRLPFLAGLHDRIQHLPRRVVHHDTKINNVLFDRGDGRARCVIDLDTVMPGTVLSDFGDMMRTYLSPADEDEADPAKIFIRKDYYAAICRGFLKETRRMLTPEERHLLFDGGKLLVLIQVIRFLADHLNGDRYYPVKYPGHNLVRTRNQLFLLAALERDEKELRAILERAYEQV